MPHISKFPFSKRKKLSAPLNFVHLDLTHSIPSYHFHSSSLFVSVTCFAHNLDGVPYMLVGLWLPSKSRIWSFKAPLGFSDINVSLPESSLRDMFWRWLYKKKEKIGLIWGRMCKSAFCLQLHPSLTIWPDFPPKRLHIAKLANWYISTKKNSNCCVQKICT